MLAKDIVTQEDFEYAVRIRREIHRHPELSFDLPKTVALVERELDAMGIEWTEQYAPGSVTAMLNPKGTGITLGLRADMDALPVEEKTGLPYASEEPGKMHACGHDSHTACLLTAARVLKRYEKQLPCRVKLIFQPSEECAQSGAYAMAENGVMDDVDYVIANHCDNGFESGKLGWHSGDFMAACDPITIDFFGKTAHATIPEQGIDTIAMGMEASAAMKSFVEAEAGSDTPHIFSVNYFHGGTAHNVIADRCTLKLTFRYYDMEFAGRVRSGCIEICNRIAERIGGHAEIDWNMSCAPLHNDEELTACFLESAKKVAELVERPSRMSSEDFSWFLLRKPGMLFRTGTRNEALGCTTEAHCNDFRLDESSFRLTVEAFVQFVLDAGKLKA